MPKSERVTYTVWICIEAHEHDTDDYYDIDAPGAGVITFDTPEAAYKFAEGLQTTAESMAADVDPAAGVTTDEPDDDDDDDGDDSHYDRNDTDNDEDDDAEADADSKVHD